MTNFQHLRYASKENIIFSDNIKNAYKRLCWWLGEDIPVGSDYSEETLNTKVGEFTGYTKCEPCDGKGWNYYPTSPDGDKDICHECWGYKYEITEEEIDLIEKYERVHNRSVANTNKQAPS